LEKYAVRCGGGRNHRSGLFDAVLIKDNHLAQAARQADVPHVSLAAAVEQVRQFLRNSLPEQADAVIEVEVDTLDQLDEVLTAHPDIVLLDNMSVSQLQEAVRRRNERGLATELEASGGVSLATVREIAATGVERISVGSLTHSAATLDIGLDWVSEPLQRFP
jgi:nicotinate-nucleotide pyrophosphorylase (carboxylating)